MSEALPVVYSARHAETAWTLSGRHTGLTDLPLTPAGERNARQLGQRLKGLGFAAVFTSPLQRAVRTCELAGFGSVAKVDPDLVEWNYGLYEGRLSAEILAERPDWHALPGRLPGWRIACAGRHKGGPGRQAHPGIAGGRPSLFQWTLPSGAGRPLDRARSRRWAISVARYRRLKCFGLRTQSFAAHHPTLERRSPCRQRN